MGLSLSKIINTFTQQAPDGKEFLRVADIAPHAYDETTDELKVRVSGDDGGKNIELLKSHLNYAGLNTSATAYFGDDVRNASIQLLKPIDVSKHPKRTLVIYNHHDQPVKFRMALFYIDFSQTKRNLDGELFEIEIPAFNTEFNIPGSLVIDELNYPSINRALPGIGFDIRRTTTAPTTGHLDIYVFGGK